MMRQLRVSQFRHLPYRLPIDVVFTQKKPTERMSDKEIDEMRKRKSSKNTRTPNF
jgi:hypothetical protein